MKVEFARGRGGGGRGGGTARSAYLTSLLHRVPCGVGFRDRYGGGFDDRGGDRGGFGGRPSDVKCFNCNGFGHFVSLEEKMCKPRLMSPL